MVNNFTLIAPLLDFESEDIYYFLQILSRHKDNPEVPSKNSSNVKNYYIKSVKYLESKMDEIKGLCDFFNARAYIRLTPRSYKTTALHHLKQMAQMMADNNFKSIAKSYLSSSGSTHAKGSKRWIVDIDKDEVHNLQSIKNSIQDCEPYENNKLLAQIPTKSGIHLITTPFDTLDFYGMCSNIEIHKDNPTILYCP